MIVHDFGSRDTPLARQLALHAVEPVWIPKTHQVHGSLVVHVTPSVGDMTIEADAFVATDPGVVCHVATADCVPVLIWDAAGRVVAAVHAGWRGVAAQIVPGTVALMQRLVPSADLRVAMGPAMGAQCYEVGEEVVSACAVTVADVAPYLSATRPGHHLINLKEMLVEQLARAGVARHCVEWDETCTHCNPEYASYRRGDRSERQYSWIVIQ
jgi:YfiH family protein